MSAQPQLKSKAQNRAIWGLARARGIDGDELHQLVEEVTEGRKASIKKLNVTEADAVIARLGGQPLASRRTIQHRRRQAGINQVVQQGQLELIAMLASQRNWSPQTLTDFCSRQCGHTAPRTTKDANKVIEALKSMNRREGLWAS